MPFRITRNNARMLSIKVRARQGQIRIEIRDDGVGFDPAQSSSGQGVSNMRARMESVGGAFDVVSQKAGVALHASFPCQGLSS